jgi:hypothetical protein
MGFHTLFYPDAEPDECALRGSRKRVIAEEAVASIIYSCGTGNFLAGYLTYLGASVAACAAISMIPVLGCVFQFFSPFIFERVQYRKFAVFLLCVLFRFSLSSMFLVPLITGDAESSRGSVLVLFCIAFGAAGIVTPGLTHMILNLAPMKRRGQYFAVKQVVAAAVNGLGTLIIGRQLDHFLRTDNPYTGFMVIGVVCLCLSAVDALLLCSIHERPVEYTSAMQIRDILMPVKDAHYRPLLLYIVLGSLIGGISTSFLSVYELRILGLSHTFITTVGIAASCAGMAGGFVWGHYADERGWTRMYRVTNFFTLLCTLAWAFVKPATAHVFAPFIMIGSTFFTAGSGIASSNMQFFYSPQKGKTTYFGVTSALGSLVSCVSAAAAAALEPQLEGLLGEYMAIALLFFLSGSLGLVNYFVNIRKL